MKAQYAKELIDIIKLIVAGMHREMGTDWCTKHFDLLNNLKKKIDWDRQLENEDKP